MGHAAALVHMQVGQNLAGNHTPSFQLCMAIDFQAEEKHYARRSFAERAQDFENACRFVFRMWMTLSLAGAYRHGCMHIRGR